MPTGTLIKLVHLSCQTYLPNTRLVSGHNDTGYGIIKDEDGREVYFSHEVVESRHGFNDLRQGQRLEYALENAPYLRAASVRMVMAVAAIVLACIEELSQWQ